MLFSSLTFIFVFLPVLLLLYYLIPKHYRNHLLLVFSLVFYAWGGVSYATILILSILINHLFVKRLEKGTNHKNAWLKIGLTFNILVIVIFKYLDFIIKNVNGLGNLASNSFHELPFQNITLPLGISFFTFQQMSLLWDVYRNPSNSNSKLFNTALYVSFFPQLIAGPIVRYNSIIEQIKSRTESISLFRSGVQRFIIGLSKKILLANTCGELADTIMSTNVNQLSTPAAWLGIIAYAFQIFYDFSGYSDMAIGLGRMFGFKIDENFNLPYISTSIQEFWRRWHISLSTWFRDYVYIPLGGNRKGAVKTYSNLIIVFLLTGFWHGATWSFVLWGAFHGFFLIVEKLGLDKVLNRVPKIISWAYTIVVVLVGWVLFRIERLSDAVAYISKLFGGGTNSNEYFISYLNIELITVLIVSVLVGSNLINWTKLKFGGNKILTSIFLRTTYDLVLISLFILSVTYINSGSYNPFIYFRF